MFDMMLEVIRGIMSTMDTASNLCEPAAKLLSKIFWFTTFTGFHTNDEAIEEIDKKLDEKYEKCRENKTFKKVEDGLEKTVGFFENLIFDSAMLILTAGLWIFWMIIRHYIRKNKRRA